MDTKMEVCINTGIPPPTKPGLPIHLQAHGVRCANANSGHPHTRSEHTCVYPRVRAQDTHVCTSMSTQTGMCALAGSSVGWNVA